jgi:actin-related protein 6
MVSIYLICSFFFLIAGALSAHRYFRDNPSELCCIIVDSGYSFTHIVPYCRSKKKKEAIIR